MNFIKEINSQNVGGGNIADLVQLNNGLLIAIDVESISVFKSINEYFECRDALNNYKLECSNM